MTDVATALGERKAPRTRRHPLAWLGSEAVLAPLGALVLAVLMTWPTMLHPATTVPQDVWDPTVFAWILAWPGHALLTQPTDFWQANTFFPEPDTFAFTDSLLGYAPLSFIGSGPVAAIVRYNIVFVLIPAFAFGGGYALARQLGSRRPGAVVAGAAFAYAPWRLAQAGHPNVLSVGGMALTFAALARGHGYSFRDGYQPDRVRAGWIALGWAIGCWQLTIGFAVGLPFAYVLMLVCLAGVVGWLLARRPALPGKLVASNAIGGAAFAFTGAAMAVPYLRIAERYPHARRGEADVTYFSPPLRGFFTAPPESWFWGDLHAAARARIEFPPEMTLLPGLVLAVVAVIGLVLSAWTVRQRLALAAATAVSVVLAMGTTLFGGNYTYLPLLRYVPGWDALRTPGRMVLWTTLGLGLLAAGAVTAAGDRIAARGIRVRPRLPVWATAALLIPGLLVIGEGVNQTPHPPIRAEPAGLRGVDGPMLVLPTEHFFDMWVMYWSTDGFPKVMNGSSSFNPTSLAQAREVTKAFPDATSVEYLQRLGVRRVVLLRGYTAGTPWEHAAEKPTGGLPLRRADSEDAIVFTLGAG